jgi:hypothetical protein
LTERNKTRAMLALALVATAFLAAPESLRAEAAKLSETDQAKVKEHLDRGQKFYADGAYEASKIEFQRAYDLSGNYKILYNLGLIDANLNDYAGALAMYEKYLALGGKEVSAARVKEADKEIARLRTLVAKVELTTNVGGADVTIDEVAIGKTPLASALVVNPGKHRIGVSKDGYQPSSKSVTLAASEVVKVDLPLVEKKSESSSPTSTVTPTTNEPPPVSPPTGSHPTTTTTTHRSFPTGAWILTGALTGAALTTGILAITSSRSLSDERASNHADPSRLDSLSSKTKTWALVADIAAGLALVSGGVSLYLTLRPGAETPKESAVHLNVSTNGLSLAGTF